MARPKPKSKPVDTTPKDLWTQLREATNEDYHYEKERTCELRDLRNAEIEAELAHPECCDLAKNHLFPYREIDWKTDTVLNDGHPSWKCSFPTKWSDEHSKKFLTLTFCPFCGTKLPALQKKANPPPHIVIENDGRCGRCKERLGRYGSCMCSYPESAWEIVRSPV